MHLPAGTIYKRRSSSYICQLVLYTREGVLHTSGRSWLAYSVKQWRQLSYPVCLWWIDSFEDTNRLQMLHE